jgi:hypothetical protein
MRKILSVAFAALVIGTGAAAAQTSVNPSLAPSRPDLPEGTGGEATMSPADIRVKLMVDGYTNVSNLTREGEIYNGYATKDGSNKRLSIDARDGKILQAVDAP